MKRFFCAKVDHFPQLSSTTDRFTLAIQTLWAYTKTMKRTTSGFTIVELLIVIVVIAILATISIVAYNGVQDRAIATAVKADLATFAKKIELARVDSSDGGYPAAPTQAMGIEVSKSNYQTNGRSNWYYCASADHTNYALGVVDSKNRGYYQSSVSGIQDGGTGVGAVNTCNIVRPDGIGYTIGYNWNGTTGTWATWTN
jgi:prepilin-type N-terminal cleavage/methylation domain-containing protein